MKEKHKKMREVWIVECVEHGLLNRWHDKKPSNKFWSEPEYRLVKFREVPTTKRPAKK